MVATQLLLETFAGGILLGGIYALAAIGLSMTFGIMDIVNMAHGHLLMVGGYVAVILFAMVGISPIIGMVLAMIILFVIGVALQKLTINQVIDEGMEPPILITFGIALVLQNLGEVLLGTDAQSTSLGFSGTDLYIGEVLLSFPRVVTFTVAILLVGMTWALIQHSSLGQAIRATAQNRDAAEAMGIDTEQVFAISMGLGAALAGAAGALLSTLFPITPYFGWSFLLKAFAVVVLGGVGSIPGTLIGGLVLGTAENFGALFLGGGLRELVAFIIFLSVLILKPNGLWGGDLGGE